MTEPIDEHINRLSEFKPAARKVITEVVAQLQGHLPLESPEALQQALEQIGGLRVGENQHEIAELAQRLPREVFPIKDLGALITKTAAALRLAEAAWRRGINISISAIEELSRGAVVAAGQPNPADGILSGPSVFGYTLAD